MKSKKPTTDIIHIIHTSFVAVEQLTGLFREFVPSATVRHTVDDSLLAEVINHGGVTHAVTSRMCEYYKAAEAAGANLIFNQCSSVGEAADVAAQLVNVPVIKVDARMAETACRTGRRIGVVATLPSTLDPTCRLIESTARRLRREVTIHRKLVAGAFDILIQGDRKRHNAMVIRAIRQLARRVDVIVCAQGSMAAILPELGETPVPVLTSPRSGVESVADFLARNGGNGVAGKPPRRRPSRSAKRRKAGTSS